MAIVSNFELKKLRLRVKKQLLKLLVSKTNNPFTVYKKLNNIKRKYKSVIGDRFIGKASKVDGRYFWRLGAPGFPSEAIKIMQDKELNRFFFNGIDPGLRTLMFGITKKCLMKCEHCFERENLNKADTLSVDDIVNIIHKYQAYGATQFMFGGGEPMLRVKDLYKILNAVNLSKSDFWIVTSGLGFDAENAVKLKENGLTGVMVSIDHFISEEHNRFRKFENAYELAVNAIKFSNEAKLVTAAAICTTKEFLSTENLDNYMNLAKSLGVTFVQFIEPRSKGGYKDKKVELNKTETNILEEAYLRYNTSKQYRDYPIINYLGYHQRKLGCFGGGDRLFYIDTDGYAHLCPYCEGQIADAKRLSPEELIKKLSEFSCHRYTSMSKVF